MMLLVRVLRSLLLLLFVPLFTMVCSVISILIIAPFASRKSSDRFIRFWARGVVAMSGIKIHVQGLENLSGVSSVILVSNHLSHYDIPVLFAAIPLSFRMVAKIELFRIPIFGPALRALGFVPVVRQGGENSKASLQSIEEKFQQGGSIWIAPEGTRQKEPRIGDFKLGAFYFALRTGRALVPICIYGTQRVLPPNSLLASLREWRPQVWIQVLPPVWPEDKGADGALRAQDGTGRDRRGSGGTDSRHALRDSVRDLMVREFSKLRDGKISSCLDGAAE